MKLHLLRCCQESKASAAREILTARLKDCIPRCFWAGCSTSFEYTGINVAEQVASHITSHFLSTAPEYCLWNGCLRPIENHIELSSHLFQDHGVPCKLTLPTSVYFCYECSLWIESDLNWANHCSDHLQTLPIFYGLVCAYGIVAVAGRCPFCFGQSEYRQFPELRYFNAHVNQHINKLPEGPADCPVCKHTSRNPCELRSHLDQIHGVYPTGMEKSLKRKRQRNDGGGDTQFYASKI